MKYKRVKLPRVIPVMLIEDGGVYKTKKFKEPRYIGDPVNSLKLFNDLSVDELVILDIGVAKKGKAIDWDLLTEMAQECFMPLAYGGGVDSMETADRLFSIGYEKILICTEALTNLELISALAEKFGSQSVVVCIDYQSTLMGKVCTFSQGGKKKHKRGLKEVALELEQAGVGEIILQSIQRDGMRAGYDLAAVREIAGTVSVPIVACGGGSDLLSLKKAVVDGKASAVAAGSMFVYQGSRDGILINYPSRDTLIELFTNDEG